MASSSGAGAWDAFSASDTTGTPPLGGTTASSVLSAALGGFGAGGAGGTDDADDEGDL